MPAGTPTRLRKADRRAQLLDVAADLVLRQGIGAVTMERLAQRAGVSKALVYLHFDNAESVLRDLYRREVAHLAAQILAAVDVPAAPEERLRRAVRVYFDIVRARGALFTVLSTGSSVPAQVEDGQRIGRRFTADLFRRIFDLPPRRATVAASLFLGALGGGVDAWTAGDLRRREVEEAAVSMALHLAGEG